MTPQELNRLLVSDVLSLAQYLLPAGKRNGQEWCAGSISGEAGNSLKVRIEGPKAGVWCDFATDDKGDLLDLWGRVKGTSFVETLDQVKEYLGVIEDRPKFKERRYRLPEKPKCGNPNEKLLGIMSQWGISEEAVKRLKVGQKGNAMVFPYFSPDSVLELVKYRDMDEKKFWSNKDPIPCLFGWQAVDENVREIVICEGEKDALTFWQQGIPALSVPKGAGSGGKQDWIEYEFERLERFSEIYICMDHDKAGQEAVVEILDRLGRHRCKVVSLVYGGHQYKDPNETHLDGISLTEFLKAARTIDPDELKRLSDFHDEILEELNPEKKAQEGTRLPWSKSFNDVRLRKSEVTVWAGINSHGKSVLLSHVMVDSVTQRDRWCVASMEMPATKLGAKVYQQAGGVQHPAPKYSAKIRELIDHNIFIFTTYGTAKADKILEVFEYARRRYGVNHFLIDSLSKCGFAEDDYKGQKGLVDRLFEYSLENRVHVHLVVHMRKNESEEKVPGKWDRSHNRYGFKCLYRSSEQV